MAWLSTGTVFAAFVRVNYMTSSEQAHRLRAAEPRRVWHSSPLRTPRAQTTSRSRRHSGAAVQVADRAGVHAEVDGPAGLSAPPTTGEALCLRVRLEDDGDGLDRSSAVSCASGAGPARGRRSASCCRRSSGYAARSRSSASSRRRLRRPVRARWRRHSSSVIPSGTSHST
jgi:hypothetical protein